MDLYSEAMRSLLAWLSAPSHGVPRIALLFATTIAVLLFGACLMIFVGGRLLANSVQNDTIYTAVCKEPGPGILQGPFEIEPGRTKDIGVGDCRIFDHDDGYLGCLVTKGNNKTFHVSAFDPRVTYHACTIAP